MGRAGSLAVHHGLTLPSGGSSASWPSLLLYVSTVPLPMRTPAAALGPTHSQRNLILTDHICKGLIPK